MDKAELMKDHPELFAEIVAEAKASVVPPAPTPDPEIKVLKESFTALKEENLALKKENDVRREKELKSDAAAIFTEKLAASTLPERLHDKIRAMVDYNKFVKDNVLDTKAFGEAVDAEIKDWVDRGVTSNVVLGESTATKQTTTTDKGEEEKKLADRLLAHVQKPAEKKS